MDTLLAARRARGMTQGNVARAAGIRSCAPFIGSSRPEVMRRRGRPGVCARSPIASARRAISASLAIVAARIRAGLTWAEIADRIEAPLVWTVAGYVVVGFLGAMAVRALVPLPPVVLDAAGRVGIGFGDHPAHQVAVASEADDA